MVAWRSGLPILQSLIPSALYWAITGVPLLDISAFTLWLLAGCSWRSQLVLRALYIALFTIGVLWTWNVTLGSVPFYLEFAGWGDLPLKGGWMLTVAGATALMLVPVPASFGPPRVIAIATLPLVVALILLKASPVDDRFPLIKDHVKILPASAGRSIIPLLTTRGGYRPEAVPRLALGPTLSSSFGAVAAGPPDKLGLLMLESWSESRGALMTVASQIESLGVRVMRLGYTRYQGGTLQGELRELCGLQIELAANLGSREIKGCVPQHLAMRGYRVVALHGYLPHFYLRSAIWRKVGFTETKFRDAFPVDERCASVFAGVCDSRLIAAGLDLMAHPGPVFVHMLTLGSHEPVPKDVGDLQCSLFDTVPAVGASQVLARRALCHLILEAKNRPELAGAYFYVVGDHAPPTLAGSSYFPPQMVPYIVLRMPGDDQRDLLDDSVS